MTLEEKLQRILNAYLKDLSMDLDQDHGLSEGEYMYLKTKVERLSQEVIGFVHSRLEEIIPSKLGE